METNTLKFLASDDATMKIKNNEKKQEVLDFIAKDEWSRPYIMECFAEEIPDTPLFFHLYKEKFEVEKAQGIKYNVPPLANSDEELSETAKTIGFLLVYPKDGEIVAKPTRYTAFHTMCARAGISGSTIANTENKPLIDALPLSEKAQWLSRGFSLHKGTCKVLYRDGKVSSMLSSEYEIMPASEIVPKFEKRLKQDHPDLQFKDGLFSHEYLVLDYMLNNTVMEASFLSMLQEYGVAATSIKAGVRFNTSDIGNSCVTAAPFYEIDGLRVRLGRPIVLSHDKGHTIEQFIAKLDGLGMLFKESEDRIEELGNTEIKHAKGCFLHILDHYKTLRAGSEDIAQELDDAYPSGCNAIDIFLALSRIVDERNKRKELSPTQLVNLSEAIAKLMLLNYADYDRVWMED